MQRPINAISIPQKILASYVAPTSDSMVCSLKGYRNYILLCVKFTTENYFVITHHYEVHVDCTVYYLWNNNTMCVLIQWFPHHCTTPPQTRSATGQEKRCRENTVAGSFGTTMIFFLPSSTKFHSVKDGCLLLLYKDIQRTVLLFSSVALGNFPPFLQSRASQDRAAMVGLGQ